VIEIEEDFLVTAADVTRTGYCHKAARQWFAERDLPWMQFISPGISAKLLASYDDGIANRVIEAARKRQRK
jgi:hypothetical protein